MRAEEELESRALTVMQMPGFQRENEASPLLLSGQGLCLLPPIE